MNRAKQEKDVVIVGGGPVGLGLALDLALKGVSSLVLERSTNLHSIPKGQNLTQRTGEHFRTWGISQAVREASPVPPEFGNAGIIIYEKLLGDYHYDWFQRSAVRPYYFADNERLPQYNLERVMRERLQEFPQIRFVEGAEVNGLMQDDDRASVNYRLPDGSENTATAKYVVGCDGARSRVRDLAGIKSSTDHEGPRMALLVFRSRALHDLLERYPGKSIFNVMNPRLNGYWQFLGRVDLEGGWFYHSPVPADTTEDNFDFKAHLHEMAGAEFELEFEHIGFWDLRISLAKTYRNRRVLIAGDACHSHPPYGGYGINTGLEDARNLSWKLDALLKGWGGEDLLDSYTAERRPVFESVSKDFIERMIADFGGFLSTYSPTKDRQEFDAAWQSRAHADDEDVTKFLPHYGGSPLVWGNPGRSSGAKGTHSFEARAGYHLAPQPLPGGADLWEELGPGFTLMVIGHFSNLARLFETAAQALNIPLKVLFIADTNLQSTYGAEAILVRPDQFIAWAGPGDIDNAHNILTRAIGKSG